jgi:uncharacterized membrane protein YkvA (DUF1232 family)
MQLRSSSRRWLEPIARFLARHPRWMIAGVIAYILLPFDLVPEAILGPIGFLDDFVVMLIPILVREYLRTLNRPADSHDDVIDTTAR